MTVRIVIFNWRDYGQPRAGGAEFSTHVLARGLASRGHDVTWFTSKTKSRPSVERRDGYAVLRHGNELTCRLHAIKWLVKNDDQIDVVLDEVNTLPFLSPLIARDRVVLWMHQLAREVWLAEAPPLIGHLGFITEKSMLRVYSGVPAVTVSDSSAKSIEAYRRGESIAVIENALAPPLHYSDDTVPGRLGYVGRLTPSKRVDHIIRATALLRTRIANAHLLVIGDGSENETRRLKRLTQELGISSAVHFTGHVPNRERDRLLSTVDAAVMASLREGWGLVVSEAARYGVPAVAYPVAGLVDSVVDGHTGVIASEQTPHSLAAAAYSLLSDRRRRRQMGQNAMRYIQQFSESRFIDQFEALLIARAHRPHRSSLGGTA